ncbi:MAG TPA: DMT family transporter [Vicinamibacterales bacterium]|nr:DMT family transporter [Vicinamibacterales bacterium]
MIRIHAVWWIACLLWSGGWLFIKVGLSDLPPLTFAALRLMLAFVVLAAIVAARREWAELNRRDLPIIAVSGVLLLGVNYALTFWGAQYLPSALTSVLQATSPAFGFLIGITTGAERFSLARGLALPLGIAGVALISSARFGDGTLAGWASVAVVSGAACAALAYALTKRRSMHLPPTVMVAMQTLFAMVPLLATALVVDGNPLAHRWTTSAIVALLYLAIASSVVAFWLNYWLLKRVSATMVLSMALVQPLVAAALGAIVLGERFGMSAAVGGGLILTSAAVILRRE